MRVSIEWLERVRAKLAKQRAVPVSEISDYAVSKALGVTRQCVSNIKHSRNQMDNYTAARVAEVTGEDLAKVIASIEAERAYSKERRAYWRSIAGMAATLMLALCLWTGGPGGHPVQAATAFNNSQISAPSEVHIMRTMAA